MIIFPKCEYCEENEATVDLSKYPVIFFTKDFISRNNICESCFKKLEKDRSLTSIKGFTAKFDK